MILQWVAFAGLVVVTYTCISVFAQLSGGSSTSALSAFLAVFRPVPLALVVGANMFFGLGLYYGFGLTRYAIPVAFAIGSITSVVYSVMFLSASVTFLKIVGVAVVILGVVLMSL